MTVVKVKNDKWQIAVNILKKKTIKEGLFKEIKRRKHYNKPSLARRLKSEEAEKQRHKDRKRGIQRSKVSLF